MRANLREKLEAELGKRVPDQVWRLLIDDGYVQEVDKAECDADREEGWRSLKKRARLLNNLVETHGLKTTKPRVHRERRVTALRSAAMAALLADDARTLPELRRFRKAVLSDKLMTLEESAAWIEAQAERGTDEAFLRFLKEVRSDKSITLEEFAARVDAYAERNPRKAYRYLTYIKPGSEWQHVVRAGKHSVLARLQVLTNNLCRRYLWLEPQAVAFVLTDSVPLVAGRIEWTISIQGLKRLRLDVPAWYSEDDVLQMYRQARAQFQGVRAGKKRYPRSLAERTAHMVVFVAERLNEAGQPRGGWEAIRRLWNEKYANRPQWQYTTAKSLASDYHRAAKRLWRT